MSNLSVTNGKVLASTDVVNVMKRLENAVIMSALLGLGCFKAGVIITAFTAPRAYDRSAHGRAEWIKEKGPLFALGMIAFAGSLFCLYRGIQMHRQYVRIQEAILKGAASQS